MILDRFGQLITCVDFAQLVALGLSCTPHDAKTYKTITFRYEAPCVFAEAGISQTLPATFIFSYIHRTHCNWSLGMAFLFVKSLK